MFRSEAKLKSIKISEELEFIQSLQYTEASDEIDMFEMFSIEAEYIGLDWLY